MMRYAPRLPFPSQRAFERSYSETEYRELGERLRQAYAPNTLYRAILFWVRRQALKEGLAHYAFIDMCGGRPTDADKEGSMLHLDDSDFEKWMYLRGERSRREWQRIKAKRKRDAGSGKLGRPAGEVRASRPVA
jgi:hypothetical protein